MFPGERSLPVANQGPGRSPALFPTLGAETDASQAGADTASGTDLTQPPRVHLTDPSQPAAQGVQLDGLLAGTYHSRPVASRMTPLPRLPLPRASTVELPVTGSKKSRMPYFQGIHHSLCLSRRQCAFATHRPIHSPPENKEPIDSPEGQGAGQHLFQETVAFGLGGWQG